MKVAIFQYNFIYIHGKGTDWPMCCSLLYLGLKWQSSRDFLEPTCSRYIRTLTSAREHCGRWKEPWIAALRSASSMVRGAS